ncbi:trehalose-6-phosphate synthase [Dactylosporangium sp. NPDC048998]|uniref:trehalose-6-phosphate synthase n=1 Tax=Dactylosporangium sp. NPDC048998 TaxID=3363976 RepID=UPI003712E37E
MPNRTPVLVAAKAAPVAHEVVDGAIVARLNGSTGSVAGDIAGTFDVTVVASAATEADVKMARRHPDGLVVRSAGGRDIALQLVEHAPQTLDPAHYGHVTELLWHSMHGLWDGATEPTFGPATEPAWAALHALNDDIAGALLRRCDRAGAAYLVQDYQLSLVPARLRAADPRARILYFHHIAWPGPDQLAMLPGHVVADLMAGVLAADVVAVFAERWRRRFLRCVEEFVPGAVVDHDTATVHHHGRTTRVAVEPLSYGADAVDALDRRWPAELEAWVADGPLLVHAGRTDPIKNADRAVQAFEHAVTSPGGLDARLLVRLQPHRLGIAANRDYRDRVAAAVARANERIGAERVRLLIDDDRRLTFGCLARADVVLVNSVIDGQNLTAFECSAVGRRNPVLVITPTCGASEVLGDDALLVHPFDIVELAGAMRRAVAMPAAERAARGERMRAAGDRVALPKWAARQLRLLDAPQDEAGE